MNNKEKFEPWLMQGDCIEKMKLISDGLVDLTVTSPPYDNLRTYNDSLQWNEDIWKEVLQELYRVTKKGGVVVWVVADATLKGSETGTSFKQALYAIECGFNLHDTMIWKKTNPLPLNSKRYEPSFEYMFVFSKSAVKKWNPIKEPSKHAGKKAAGSQIAKDGTRKEKWGNGREVKKMKVLHNVWETSVGGGKTGHPAPFPMKLAEDHITSWSNPGDIVLDPFLGSGTTGVACKNLDRKFIGIERDETYFKLASDRINE